MNRYIDERRMNQSREKTIETVLETISVKQTTSFFSRTRMIVISSLVLIAALVLSLTVPNGDNPGQEIVINAYESERIAEITYITSSLIGSNISLSNTDMIPLSNFSLFDGEDSTKFEENDELINLYFDTLRVFLDEDTFQDHITVTQSENDPNTQIISFTILNIEYSLTITFTNELFTGQLLVGDVTYDVTGKLEESLDELKLELEAINGDDYVQIKFESEKDENEIERKYQIKERVNGSEKEQEIKVSHEQSEYKIEIKDGENEYQLKKELEGTQYEYKLEYKINGTEGEAIITESVDGNGQVIYQYQVKEGNQEKEVETGRPDYDHEASDNENGKNGDGNGGNQNFEYKPSSKKELTV